MRAISMVGFCRTSRGLIKRVHELKTLTDYPISFFSSADRSRGREVKDLATHFGGKRRASLHESRQVDYPFGFTYSDRDYLVTASL
jgi:hypothetical protein